MMKEKWKNYILDSLKLTFYERKLTFNFLEQRWYMIIIKRELEKVLKKEVIGLSLAVQVKRTV